MKKTLLLTEIILLYNKRDFYPEFMMRKGASLPFKEWMNLKIKEKSNEKNFTTSGNRNI